MEAGTATALTFVGGFFALVSVLAVFVFWRRKVAKKARSKSSDTRTESSDSNNSDLDLAPSFLLNSPFKSPSKALASSQTPTHSPTFRDSLLANSLDRTPNHSSEPVLTEDDTPDCSKDLFALLPYTLRCHIVFLLSPSNVTLRACSRSWKQLYDTQTLCLARPIASTSDIESAIKLPTLWQWNVRPAVEVEAAGLGLNLWDGKRIFTAVEKGEEIRVLESDNVFYLDREGWSALMIASKIGSTQAADALLHSGAPTSCRENRTKFTALLLATLYGHTTIVSLLLSFGADVNARNHEGSSSLLLAASEGNVAVVRLLLKAGARCGLADKRGSTPLIRAASSGHADVVSELLAAGADVDAKDAAGNTAWVMADLAGFDDVSSMLQPMI